MTVPVAVILAAGKSTRMKSELPKVLHPVCGRMMIEFVLDAARDAGGDAGRGAAAPDRVVRGRHPAPGGPVLRRPAAGDRRTLAVGREGFRPRNLRVGCGRQVGDHAGPTYGRHCVKGSSRTAPCAAEDTAAA